MTFVQGLQFAVHVEFAVLQKIQSIDFRIILNQLLPTVIALNVTLLSYCDELKRIGFTFIEFRRFRFTRSQASNLGLASHLFRLKHFSKQEQS